jgi:mRNA-degrading endonuclease RelE of RelBE toxin-antitoxin system
MYEYRFSPLAQRRLDQIAKRNPHLATTLIRKIEWLAQNVDTIAHQRLTGSSYYSLHSASYRIAYKLYHAEQQILIIDLGQHDAAYSRVNRLR